MSERAQAGGVVKGEEAGSLLAGSPCRVGSQDPGIMS